MWQARDITVSPCMSRKHYYFLYHSESLARCGNKFQYLWWKIFINYYYFIVVYSFVVVVLYRNLSDIHNKEQTNRYPNPIIWILLIYSCFMKLQWAGYYLNKQLQTIQKVNFSSVTFHILMFVFFLF